jgi:hypothetical protein
MSLSFDDRPAARSNILEEKCFFADQAPTRVGAANTSVCRQIWAFVVAQALLPAVSTLVSRHAESIAYV